MRKLPHLWLSRVLNVCFENSFTGTPVRGRDADKENVDFHSTRIALRIVQNDTRDSSRGTCLWT
jgi:hypothetical protein